VSHRYTRSNAERMIVTEAQHRKWVAESPYQCARYAAPGIRCVLDHLHKGDCLTRQQHRERMERSHQETSSRLGEWVEQVKERGGG
jgi:hypothetical protein